MDSRAAMPNIAKWIDQLRKTFGDDEINRQMQRGVRGEPVFHAWENGHEIGTPLPRARGAIRIDVSGNYYAEDYPQQGTEINAENMLAGASQQQVKREK